MRNLDLSSENANSSKPKSILNRRWGNTAAVVLASLLCSGALSASAEGKNSDSGGGFFAPGESIVPDFTGYMVGALVGIGAVATTAVVLSVKHSHHTLKGCAITGPQGLQLQTSDSRVYVLEGDAASIKPGNRIKIHGSKIKKASLRSGPEVFAVKKVLKTYGPCGASPNTASSQSE